MSSEFKPARLKPWEVIFLIAMVIGCLVLYSQLPDCETDCLCGHDGIETPFIEEADFELTETGRKIRKIWFEHGTVAGLTQAEFQRRVMAGLREVSAFTNTDFVQVQSQSGAWLKVYAASDEMMWEKRPDLRKAGLIPLELQDGNWMYFTVRNRWGLPNQRVLERAAIHGTGHRIGLGHSSDPNSIMRS